MGNTANKIGTWALLGTVPVLAYWLTFPSAPEPHTPRAFPGVQVSDTAHEQASAHAEQIHQPAKIEGIRLDASDPLGREVVAGCGTCHTTREPNLRTASADSLDQFHVGMQFSHGNLRCYACHDPQRPQDLRRADGTRVAVADAMELCSQCHGPEAEAYQHGAHGGMNGAWDLEFGARYRNHCIDCHDPHVPQYPKMIVTFKPLDRFLVPKHEDHDTP